MAIAKTKEITLDFLNDHEADKDKDYVRIIKWIKRHSKKSYPKIANWILAGSGNYIKTPHTGRYRESCNTIRDTATCENHKIKSFKVLLTHCGKLDCSSCFTYACSDRARKINRHLQKFKEQAKKHGLRVGNVIHIILTPEKSLALKNFQDYKKYLTFRRKEVYAKLKKSGILGGYVFTQAWSLKCTICGKSEKECKCQNKDSIEWDINIHFHVLRYGYLLNTKKFRERYKDWIVINAGRREDAYTTAFYILSHGAIWRKEDGKLTRAYESFGWLKSNKFILVKQKVVTFTEKCKHCNKPLRKTVDGVEIKGDLPKFNSTITLQERARKLAIKTVGITLRKMTEKLNKCVYKNKNLNIKVSPKKLVFGNEVKYVQVIREYEIKNVEKLKKDIKRNREMYLEDLRERRKRQNNSTKRIEKEGNDYG